VSLPPGARLGPYEIVAKIGAGGMGEVFRARDSRLGRDVALKVLPADVSARPDRLRRFEKDMFLNMADEAAYADYLKRWRAEGTHLGPFMGTPPTGKFVSTSGITIFRLQNGRIIEEWGQSDTIGLLQQVGAMPGPGGSPANDTGRGLCGRVDPDQYAARAE